MIKLYRLDEKNFSSDFNPDVIEASYQALELHSVLEELARHAQTAPGKSNILDTYPEMDIEQIERNLDLVVE